MQPDVNFKQVEKTDLIIIPPAELDIKILNENKVFVPWIVEQYKQGAEVAALCTGTFILALTGLIDDKDCSTHWVATDDFRRLFPEINLVPDKLITDENGIYTSGGAILF